ncbi:MAG: hypothetical protein WCK88_08190 [bacterium]
MLDQSTPFINDPSAIIVALIRVTLGFTKIFPQKDPTLRAIITSDELGS